LKKKIKLAASCLRGRAETRRKETYAEIEKLERTVGVRNITQLIFDIYI